MLQVGAAAKMLDLEAAIITQQYPLKHTLILRPQMPLQSPGAAVAVGADFQNLGLRLSKAHHVQAQGATFHFRIEHAPHGVALLRPQVQDALAFARDRILGRGEVKQDLAIFNGDRVRRAGQKLFQHFGEKIGRDGGRLHRGYPVRLAESCVRRCVLPHTPV